MNFIDPRGLAMQDAALERDHCGGGGGACVAFGIVALADYLGAGIKKAGETITDGVRQGDTGQEKKYRQGHLLQKPISRKEKIRSAKCQLKIEMLLRNIPMKGGMEETIFYPTKESPQDYFNRNFKCRR